MIETHPALPVNTMLSGRAAPQSAGKTRPRSPIRNARFTLIGAKGDWAVKKKNARLSS